MNPAEDKNHPEYVETDEFKKQTVEKFRDWVSRLDKINKEAGKIMDVTGFHGKRYWALSDLTSTLGDLVFNARSDLKRMEHADMDDL